MRDTRKMEPQMHARYTPTVLRTLGLSVCICGSNIYWPLLPHMRPPPDCLRALLRSRKVGRQIRSTCRHPGDPAANQGQGVHHFAAARVLRLHHSALRQVLWPQVAADGRAAGNAQAFRARSGGRDHQMSAAPEGSAVRRTLSQAGSSIRMDGDVVHHDGGAMPIPQHMGAA